MPSLYETLILNFGLNIIKSLVKNPAHAAGLKSHLIEIRDGINALYPGE